MNACYLDTSALVKRYVNEIGSVWLRAMIDPSLQPLNVASHLLVAEVTGTFNRRVREGTLSARDYAHLLAAFRHDCLREYHILPVSAAVIDSACVLMERHPLRTLDAIHLATGLAVQQFLAQHGLAGLTFLSADDRLLAAARAEGLAVENPAQHP